MNTRWNVAIRILVGLASIVGVLFGFTHPVIAKGPESVTIAGPGIDQPLELIDTANQDLIAQLMEQTGLWYGTGEPLQEEQLGELGPAYTLTWVNMGPPEKSVEERTIRQEIYLDAENGPLIHTQDQLSLQGWGPEVIGWFAAPVELRATLIELGALIVAESSPAKQPLPEIASAQAMPERQLAVIPRSIAILGFTFLIVLAAALGVIWRRAKNRTSPIEC
jgi:hypothetical protein